MTSFRCGLIWVWLYLGVWLIVGQPDLSVDFHMDVVCAACGLGGCGLQLRFGLPGYSYESQVVFSTHSKLWQLPSQH